MTLDASTVANIAQAIAVIVAVAFGIQQLRSLAAVRRREAAFALMQSLQTPQVLRGMLLIDKMPDGLTLADINALPQEQQESLVGLLGVWESLGVLVFEREVSLDVVDDFFSGTILQSWRKLARYVEDLRRHTGRDTRWEWFQWLAERMAERETSAPPVPAHVEHRDWRPGH
jgi:hypothetical protein